MLRIEDTIIAGLLRNEDYARKVAPFLELDYFREKSDQFIVRSALKYFVDYGSLPPATVIAQDASKASNLTDEQIKSIGATLEHIKGIQLGVDEWMLKQTEDFCRERSIYNAIRKSISIIEGEDKKNSPDAIPKMLQDALAVTFDTAVGHSYLEDASSRYDFYSRKEERIPFDLEMFNTITRGGLPRKTLTCFAASSGGGKSLVMCHIAAGAIRQGQNVLYISMEMSEEKIAERIDANLMNVEIDRLHSMGKDEFMTKVSNIQAKTRGKLIIKEYPTAGAHAGHFRALIEELKIKKNFKPDLIIVDYLGICASSRVKMTGGVNTYTYIKSVAEEIRGLAVEYDAVAISASQVNRNGYSNTELEATDTSDSMGIVHTVDLYLGIIRTDELDELGQILFKQLKNRYDDPSNNRKFVMGINRAKMKLYDLEKSAQAIITPPAKRDAPPVPMSTTKRPANLGTDFKF